MRRLALFVAAFVAAAVPVPALADEAATSTAGSVSYRPPVEAPVVDPFRPPATRWGPGNRGLQYDTAPGTSVGSAADGEVVFAGPVAGSLHVVVLHADGIRTSYSFLESIAVRRGDRVVQGQAVGTAGEHLHFGARVGDVYIDPATLFNGAPPEVWLVPEEVRRPQSEQKERGGLVRMLLRTPGNLVEGGGEAVGWARDGLDDAAGFTADAAGWVAGRSWGAAGWAAGRSWDAAGWAAARSWEAAGWAAATSWDAARWSAAASWDAAEWGARQAMHLAVARFEELRGLLHYAHELSWSTHAWRAARTVTAWWKQRGRCSSGGASPSTPRPGAGHVAVLVGGFGSTSDKASIDDVDTAALGYQPDDVVRFSYLGGTTDEQPYEAVDTTVDIRQSGRRLRELLVRLAAEHPGQPIDILAHSQGGLVARTALAYEADPGDRRLAPVRSLVTLASPHRGTDGATALRMLGHTGVGSLVGDAGGAVLPENLDPDGVSLAQMAETSEFLRRLNRRPLPPGVHAVSIGARDDLVVPAGRTRLPGADHVVVSVPGLLEDHSRLPGSAAAQREVELALARRPPSCQSLADMLVDNAVSDAIGIGEDGAGALLWAGGRWLDARLPNPLAHGPERNP